MKSRKTKYILMGLTPAATLWNAGQAYAQQASSQSQLGEIIVTAQKRSENLQNVPIAISALEAKTADALGLKTTTDLAFTTPGLVMHHQTNTVLPALRGISQTNPAGGDESPIAIYVDGVYYVSPSAGIFSFNNIDRIEVLKGPQGTLFGRNAVGGVISVITARPKYDFAGKMHIGYGNYNTYDGDLYTTTGITNKIATDLSVYWHRQNDGYGKNLTTGNGTFKNRDFAIRNKWLLQPSDATDVTFAADYGSGQDPMGVAKDSLPGTLKVVGPPHRGGFFDLQGNVDDKVEYKQWGASAEVDQNFDWARLVSISAYRKALPRYIQDNDSTSLNVSKIDSPDKSRQITQEFQILSPQSNKLKWIVGFFYLNNKNDYTLIATGMTTVTAPPTFRRTFSVINTRSLAGFGEVTLPLGEATNATAGLRYTSDKQHIVGAFFDNAGQQIAKTDGNQRATFNKLTWRLSLDHRFAPHFMGYASYNRGFKGGVFNGSAPRDPAVNPSVLDAYQVGIKSEWLDGKLRLNGSAYWYDYKGIQLAATQGTISRLYNAAKGRIKGADLDFEVIPVRHLRLSGGVAYTDAKYTDFPNAPTATAKPLGGYTIAPADATGNEMIYTPKWSYNANAIYTIPTGLGNFDVAGNYYYNGDYFPDPANQFRQKSYHLINASLGWTSSDDRLSAKLWAKNLNNAHYYNHITVNPQLASASPSPPRTYGVTLGFKWGGH